MKLVSFTFSSVITSELSRFTTLTTIVPIFVSDHDAHKFLSLKYKLKPTISFPTVIALSRFVVAVAFCPFTDKVYLPIVPLDSTLVFHSPTPTLETSTLIVSLSTAV